MPRIRKIRIPKYREKNGYGHCRIRGIDYYFGKFHPTPPPEYWDLIAKYKSGQPLTPAAASAASAVVEPLAAAAAPLAATATDQVSIEQLIELFLNHAETEYRRPDGSLGTEYDNYRQAMRPLFTLFADERADDFTPRKFKRLQEYTVRELDWCRSNANKQFSRIKSVFKWGVSEEHVPPHVFHALQTVRAIKSGRLGVRETQRVEMVPDAVVDKTLNHLPPMVADMVRLHRLIGGRSQDVCNIRWSDIDRREPDVWLYHPPEHKQAWRGHIRTLYIDAAAQAILLKYEHRPPDAYLFSPLASEKARRRELYAARVTPASCGNRRGTNRKTKPKRSVGDRYTPGVYRRAITRACEAAFPCPRLADVDAEVAKLLSEGQCLTKASARKQVAAAHPKWMAEIRRWNRDHHWHPHRLRHLAGTVFADAGGLEYSRMRLGHRHVRTTELYQTIQDEAVIRKIREIHSPQAQLTDVGSAS